MKTVHEVSKLTKVSIRTLHYYDSIGLLQPTQVTEAGYRLYDDTALERLQNILLFRELQFPLKEIKKILDSPHFDKQKALEQQITLLELQREHLERLIDYAREIKRTGEWHTMNFEVFDTGKMDEYAAQAKAAWGDTDAYKEYEEKSRTWTRDDMNGKRKEFMQLFAEFGRMRDLKPDSDTVQAQVEKLRNYITEHFYTCTPDILQGLGKMYVANDSMKENIDKMGGEGTAKFTADAIVTYGRKQKE